MFLKLFSHAKPPSDLELVQRYQRTGDAACMGELFERHTEMVYLVCLKYLKDEEESKDATMQLFEELLRTLRKHEVQNFRSWLHTTTKNHCLMRLRAKKQQVKALLQHLPHAGQSIETPDTEEKAAQHEETLQLLEQGLTYLPDEQRQCLSLFYLQQKSYKEIAEETGCSLTSVKSYIQNGRRNVKLYLEKNHAER